MPRFGAVHGFGAVLPPEATPGAARNTLIEQGLTARLGTPLRTQECVYPVVRRANQAETRASSRPRPHLARGGSVVELLIVVAILLVVMAIAMPRLLAAKKSAQEASAVVFLRNLHSAQMQYYITHGSYAATFAELEGFLAANQGLAPLRQFAAGTSPVPIEAMPTLAFLLLPTPGLPDSQAYTSDGPKRPNETDQHADSGSAPIGSSPGSGNSNPARGSNGESSPGADQNGGGASESDPGSGPGGSSSSRGRDGSQDGAWSKADRMTYQGYEFYLLRPTAHTWNCLAMPVRDERNGHHYFADQSGAIRREYGRPASAQSPLL